MTDMADINIKNEELLERNPGLAELLKVAKKTKYNNTRYVIDGEVYDSGREAEHAGKFRAAVSAGVYLIYIHHFVVTLPGNIRMELDHFLVTDGLKIEVWDTKASDGKATVTREWINKRKLFEATFGIKIRTL